MKTTHIFKYDCEPYQWQEFIKVFNSGEVVHIDEEMFYYWLEVLPPVYMGQKQLIEFDGVKLVKHCAFGFAEGRDFITDFWYNVDPQTKEKTAYFCKKSNRLNNWG